jgi:uncharacterized cupin superfamily protein
MSAPPVVHHADISEREVAEGDIAFRRRRLAAAAGARRIGASHYVVPPGARQMPVHVHGDEEEIVYVLGGDGIGYEQRGDSFAVGPEDVVVHRPNGRPHTFLAGDNGLELIAFASGSDTSITFLPRAGVMWCGPRWVPLDGPHPFRAEGLAGPLGRPEVDSAAPRPEHVVALGDVAADAMGSAEVRRVGQAAGSAAAGLNHVTLPAGARGASPHCHTLEEELFVVLRGSGTLMLADDAHPLAVGDVVARPPGTRVAHSIVAGAEGMTYLVYGTREPGDAVVYPEAGKVWIRGLGVWLDSAAPPAR